MPRSGTQHGSEAACSQGQEQVCRTASAPSTVSRDTLFLSHQITWGLLNIQIPGPSPNPSVAEPTGPWESVFLKSGPGASDSLPGWRRGSQQEAVAVARASALLSRLGMEGCRAVHCFVAPGGGRDRNLACSTCQALHPAGLHLSGRKGTFFLIVIIIINIWY